MEQQMNQNFDNVGADSAKCFPAQASLLRKGGFVVINDHPCKIMNMTSSKTGKHGHAKVHLVALDVFSGKRYETICPSRDNLSVPLVDRQELEISHVSHDEYFSLMTDKGVIRSDIKYNPDLCAQSIGEIRKLLAECEDGVDHVCMAQMWSSMGREEIKEVRKVKINANK